jgi:hypothetical protein
MAERHVSKVAQLHDIEAVIAERPEKAVPPATQPFVSVVAALHGDQPRFDLDLIIPECEEGVPVAAYADSPTAARASLGSR